MIKITIRTAICSILLMCAAAGCRKSEHEPVINSQIEQVTAPVAVPDGGIQGFFLLNEGNMGSNMASLDYFEYSTGQYHRNIYPERNPNVVKELGDVGNDLKIYRDRLYAVINRSNLVEVMDVQTVRSVGYIPVKNCRYITFHGDYAYVSSFVGNIEVNPNAPQGVVVKIDLVTLKEVARCTVGYQPEEMVVVGDRLYVANSGTYRAPEYDNTVSVIDLSEFRVVKTISTGPNMHRMTAGGNGRIYISSRPAGKPVPSRTYVLNTSDDSVTTLSDLPNSGMALADSRLYVYSIDLDDTTGESPVTYVVLDTHTDQIIGGKFITDGTEKNIVVPYGLAVNEDNGDIFVTDGRNFVTPGYLHCYDTGGKLKWSVRAGNIPAHIAFTTKKITPLDKL